MQDENIPERPDFRIDVYNEAARSDWNRFVGEESVNGHFMHTREFLDYHGERFTDHSLVFRRDDRIAAVLPAHRNGADLASHRGLTFGGLLVDDTFDSADCAGALSALGRHMRENGLASLDYRPSPVWYHRRIFEVDCGLLGTAGAYLPAAVCVMGHNVEFNATRRNLLKKGLRAGLEVVSGAEILPDVMGLVMDVLAARHEAMPVHTIEELGALQQQFSEGIRAYAVRSPDATGLRAGVVLFVSPHAVKLQYLGYAPDTGETGAMEMLFDHLLRAPEFHGRSFDFGTSASGDSINASLMAYKESLGGRLRMFPRFNVEVERLLAFGK